MLTVVAGTDLSESSAGALLWAADLVRAVDGRMIAVTAAAPDTFATRREIDEHLPIAESLLAAELDRLALGADVVAGSVARYGDPRGVLVSVARWHQADLVVVGASGGEALGGVIHHLLHGAHCPVAVVPANPPPLWGGTLVVGVDGTPANERALAWTVDTARRLSARVDAIYAYQPALGPAEFPWMDPAHTAGVEERAARAMVGKFESVDVSIDFHRVNGRRVAALTEHARAAGAAALVVGSRGRGSLAGRIVGRVPYQVLRDAAQPVVVVPGHDEEP